MCEAERLEEREGVRWKERGNVREREREREYDVFISLETACGGNHDGMAWHVQVQDNGDDGDSLYL